MIKLLRKIWSDRRGNALLIGAAAFPVIVGAAGLAADTIQWTLWKRQLQRAADSAAIAGVYTRSAASGATTNVEAAVQHDLGVNLHTFYGLTVGHANCAGKCVIATPADSGQLMYQVSVTLELQQRLPFSGYFMTSGPVITATSTAASVPAGGDACFKAQETNASKTGITVSGNASIDAAKCVFFSNSPAANSAISKGSSNVIAAAVAAVGGIQQSNNWHVGAYRPYSPALPDPFIGVNPSSDDMNCSATTTEVVPGNGKKPDTTTTTTGPVALTDGMTLPYVDSTGKTINCFSSLSVGSGNSLTLPSGTYYINAGDANIQGNLTCTACTIVLTNSDTTSSAPTIGQFKVNASANINMSAPTGATDKFKGIAIYQDRRAVDQSGKPNLINGNSGSVITGALYFPSQELDYNGTGNTSAVCTMFVARRLDFTGNSTTSNKFNSMSECAYAGLPTTSANRMVRLVS